MYNNEYKKVIEMGTISFFSFFYNYMVNKCKCKGGGLGKPEQGIPSFLDNTKAQMTKDGMGSDNSTTKRLDPIKFVKVQFDRTF